MPKSRDTYRLPIYYYDRWPSGQAWLWPYKLYCFSCSAPAWISPHTFSSKGHMSNWKLWRPKSNHVTVLIWKCVYSLQSWVIINDISYNFNGYFLSKFQSHIGIMINYSDLVFKTSKIFPLHDFDMRIHSELVAIEFLSTALALRVELKQWIIPLFK